MKARRKSDGKIIEVEAVICGYNEVGKAFYQASDLDFLPEKETAVLEKWIARDGDDGTIWIYSKKPRRGSDAMWHGKYQMQLPTDSFPSVTWQSEPKKVRIKIEEI